MKTERDRADWRFQLQVDITASEAERLGHRVRVRDLDEIVGRNRACDAHDLAADFARKSFLHITLALILLPIACWLQLEVFENIDKRVLPDCLNDGNIG